MPAAAPPAEERTVVAMSFMPGGRAGLAVLHRLCLWSSDRMICFRSAGGPTAELMRSTPCSDAAAAHPTTQSNQWLSGLCAGSFHSSTVRPRPTGWPGWAMSPHLCLIHGQRAPGSSAGGGNEPRSVPQPAAAREHLDPEPSTALFRVDFTRRLPHNRPRCVWEEGREPALTDWDRLMRTQLPGPAVAARPKNGGTVGGLSVDAQPSHSL